MEKPGKTYAARKQAAFNSGLLAFKEGTAVSACPILKHKGLAQSWKEGWLSGNAAKQSQSSGMFIARIPAPASRPAPSPVGRPAARLASI